ncbi:g4767 [Coccomyxa elongata]
MVLIGHFYRQYCTRSAPDNARQLVSLALLWLWSIRLKHSYLRREGWTLGAREDWRYADMRARNGRHWWWMSFFLVYAVQQLMLVGITLPLYSVHASALPWNPIWDGAAAAGCLLGIGIAAIADTQLHEFLTANERRQAGGKPPVLLLNTGLWRYSRHPNYFGEQLWWWSLGMFAVNVGQRWALAGALFNSLCMVGVTRLTEARMLARPERAALFREYQRRTSVWLPWFQRSCRTKQI